MDLGEAPVSVCGDDGGDKLGNAKGKEQGDGGTLHEEESMRASDEDKGLGDNCDLEVYDHVEHAVVGLRWRALEVDTKFILEEGGLQDDDNENNGGECEVQAVSDGISEDHIEIPAIRS